MSFDILKAVDLTDVTEKKGEGNKALTYLSWTWAWSELMKVYPDATYEIIKNNEGLPYFSDGAGAMCYTKLTVAGITHQMWLPIMNSNNKAMKSEPYTYTVKDYRSQDKNATITKTVEAFSMFDVNKTIMRCLVKNIAMFGLGIYVYAGEDFPEESEESKAEALLAVQAKNTLITAKNNMNKILSGLGAKGLEKDDILDLLADNLGSSLADCTDITKIDKLEAEINRKLGQKSKFEEEVYPDDVTIDEVIEMKE